MPKTEFTFRYKVRNWPAYNRALVRRGQLTLWFDEAAIKCAVLNRMTGLEMPETVRML